MAAKPSRGKNRKGALNKNTEPATPIPDRVDVILSNDLARAKVWRDDPLLLELTSMLSCTSTQDGCAKQHPSVFLVSAVTCAVEFTFI